MEMSVRSHRFTAQQQQPLCRYTLTSETVKMSTQTERNCCTFTSAASSRGEILRSSLLFLPSELGNPVSHSSFLPVSVAAQRHNGAGDFSAARSLTRAPKLVLSTTEADHRRMRVRRRRREAPLSARSADMTLRGRVVMGCRSGLLKPTQLCRCLHI